MIPNEKSIEEGILAQLSHPLAELLTLRVEQAFDRIYLHNLREQSWIASFQEGVVPFLRAIVKEEIQNELKLRGIK